MPFCVNYCVLEKQRTRYCTEFFEKVFTAGDAYSTLE